MTDKMTLLFVKHTGHILAAITRSADPTGKSLPKIWRVVACWFGVSMAMSTV